MSRTKRVVLTVKLALRMFEDSLCRCGHSAFIAHGENGVGEYDAKPTTCHACKEAERAGKDDDRSPGRILSVRDLHDDVRGADDELPDHSGIDVRPVAVISPSSTGDSV